eukprot:EG_transcript_29353
MVRTEKSPCAYLVPKCSSISKSMTSTCSGQATASCYVGLCLTVFDGRGIVLMMQPRQKWLFFCATIALWIVTVTGQTIVLIPFNASLPANGAFGFASVATPPGQLLTMRVVITYYRPSTYNMFKTDLALGLFSGICEVSFGGANSTVYLPNRVSSSFPGLSGTASNGITYTSSEWVLSSPFAITSRTNFTLRMSYT